MEATPEYNKMTIAIQNGLNNAQVAILTQETPTSLVKQRKGRGGQMFDFLPHEEVTRLLNSAFCHSWNTEIKNFGIIEGVETWVWLRLTVRTEHGDIWKEQFGQQDFLRNSKDEIVMSTGDALKGATSDALTKCASLLGVGLDLYGITAKERKNGGNGNGTQPGNGQNDLNVYKRQVKALIDTTRGMQINGQAVAPGLYARLNKAQTQGDLHNLEGDVKTILQNIRQMPQDDNIGEPT